MCLVQSSQWNALIYFWRRLSLFWWQHWEAEHNTLTYPENVCRHLTHVGQVAGTCGCRYTPKTWSAAERVADVRNRTPAAAGAAPLTRCWWGCDADEMRLSSTCHINRHRLQCFIIITPPQTIHKLTDDVVECQICLFLLYFNLKCLLTTKTNTVRNHVISSRALIVIKVPYSS